MTPQIQASLPKYVQIANHYRDRILRGELVPGDEIPSERRIVEEWLVSRPTATRALSALRVEGLVEARQGSGTYVRKRPSISRRARDRYDRASGTGRIYTDQERAVILDAGLAPATEPVAVALSIETGSPAVRRRRVIHDAEGPAEFSTSWFTAEIGERAPELLKTSRILQGAVHYVAQVTGRRPLAASDRATARLASDEEASALELGPSPAAVLLVHHVVFDEQSEPMEFIEAVYPPGRWSFDDHYELGS